MATGIPWSYREPSRVINASGISLTWADRHFESARHDRELTIGDVPLMYQGDEKGWLALEDDGRDFRRSGRVCVRLAPVAKAPVPHDQPV